MIIHLSLLTITTLLIYTLHKSRLYRNHLAFNLSLATQPPFKEKLDNTTHNNTIQKAIQEIYIWSKYTIPTNVLNILNIQLIWISLSHDINLPQIYTTISALLCSLTFTKYSLSNTKPTWLIQWSNLLQSTKQEIELEFVHKRLLFIKQQLSDFQQGKYINTQTLNSLKYEALFLSNYISSKYK